MSDQPILRVVFFRSSSGDEPVREWLKELDREDRKVIGQDIKLVQFRWPLGMPLVRKLETDLWEVRSRLSKDRLREFALPYEREKWRCCMGLSRSRKRHLCKNLN